MIFIQNFTVLKKQGRENAAVLYRGSSCEDSNDGSLYLNITDFMLAVEKHHDMDKAMSELDVNIPPLVEVGVCSLVTF